MSWTDPKTDWTLDDKLKPNDFNRQNDNIKHVSMVTLPELYYYPEFIEQPKVTLVDFPFSDKLNIIEDNLTAIKDSGMFLPLGWEQSKEWQPAGNMPDYTDVNRWERNVKLLYEMAIKIKDNKRPCGTFQCGGELI